ncbi:unnamed protein product, partial [Ectocarpus sp. 8 AP-2014]
SRTLEPAVSKLPPPTSAGCSYVRAASVLSIYSSQVVQTLRYKARRRGAVHGTQTYAHACQLDRLTTLSSDWKKNTTRSRSTNIADNSPLPLMCSRGLQPPQDIKKPDSCPTNHALLPTQQQ